MGLLFSLLGLVLMGYGALSDRAIYAKHSLGWNVNVIWGVVFLLFGAAMLFLTWRARQRDGGNGDPRHDK